MPAHTHTNTHEWRTATVGKAAVRETTCRIQPTRIYMHTWYRFATANARVCTHTLYKNRIITPDIIENNRDLTWDFHEQPTKCRRVVSLWSFLHLFPTFSPIVPPLLFRLSPWHLLFADLTPRRRVHIGLPRAVSQLNLPLRAIPVISRAPRHTFPLHSSSDQSQPVRREPSAFLLNFFFFRTKTLPDVRSATYAGWPSLSFNYGP